MTTRQTLDEKYDSLFKNSLRINKNKNGARVTGEMGDNKVAIGSRPNSNLLVSDMLAVQKSARARPGCKVAKK